MSAGRRTPAPTLSALFDVFVLAQAVQELLASALGDAPLGPEDYAIYSQLEAAPGSTPTELAEALAAPLTTVSDWIRRMRGRGHVVTDRRPEDRRSYTVRLSAAGRDAHRATRLHFEEVNERFLAGLTLSEDELHRVLRHAIDAARAARAQLPATT